LFDADADTDFMQYTSPIMEMMYLKVFVVGEAVRNMGMGNQWL
jgi:hypothetical protein